MGLFEEVEEKCLQNRERDEELVYYLVDSLEVLVPNFIIPN
jgi:hypothetical protein